MPVPTATFRKMKTLNVIFLISAGLMLMSTLLLVKDDAEREFNQPQQDQRLWEEAMVRDAQRRAEQADIRGQIFLLESEIEQLKSQIRTKDEIRKLEKSIAEKQKALDLLTLPLNLAKGNITPFEQEVERAKREGASPETIQALRKKLQTAQDTVKELTAKIVPLEEQLEDDQAELEKLRESEKIAFARIGNEKLRRELEQAVEADLAKQGEDATAVDGVPISYFEKALRDKEGELDGFEKKIEENAPGFLGRIGKSLRDAPLLNWTNPVTVPKQVVIQDVRTDVNFMAVETIDRCHSCHVNIDNPRYAYDNLVGFVERQIAIKDGQNVDAKPRPVVLLDFWLDAAEAAALPGAVNGFVDEQVAKLNDLTERAYKKNSSEEELAKLKFPARKADGSQSDNQAYNRRVLDAVRSVLKKTEANAGEISVAEWDAFPDLFVEDLHQLVEDNVSESEFKQLKEYYRREAIAALNDIRADEGLAALSDSPILMGHPRIDLFASPDSPHAIKTMGCTVCHEGAGQETQFVHSVHTPRDVWVDAKTGATIPEFLVAPDDHGHGKHDAHDGEKHDAGDAGKIADERHKSKQTASASTAANPVVQFTSLSAEGESDTKEDHADEANAKKKSNGDLRKTLPLRPSNDDLYIADPHDNNHPYQPEISHATAGAYQPLGDSTGAESGRVIRQAYYWKKEYGWHHVHYMHWEKPMHSLDFVESSCAKCHTEIYDIADEAPKLMEGRKLFAQVGCVNCHAMKSLDGKLDIKQVGPSLVNVKEKLTSDVISSWIWSPRSLRPTSRMPHYFMLENNSSETDIRRTRVEVAAITYYLLNAKPKEAFYKDLYKADYEKKYGVPLADHEFAIKKIGRSKYMPSYDATPLPEGEDKPADADTIKRGRTLFNDIGCMACHANLKLEKDSKGNWEEGQTTFAMVNAYAKAKHVDAKTAKEELYDMGYNQRHWAALRYLGDKLNLTGPELSAVGTKLLEGREGENGYAEAKTWLVNWLRQPRHYSAYTIMPSFRLTEEEACDIADYLLSLQRPDNEKDGWEPSQFLPAYDDPSKFAAEFDTQMLEELVTVLTTAGTTEDLARQEAQARPVVAKDGREPEDADKQSQLYFLGQKMITHYGCVGCHRINGLEDATSACAELSDWGLKDPHKLDFGYFEEAVFSDDKRGHSTVVKKVKHEGLTANAPKIGAFDKPDSPDGSPGFAEGDMIVTKNLPWEPMHHGERRPWLHLKLHNTRIFDRGKETLNPNESSPTLDVGKPYDKLKMPKFFLNDSQIESLMTYVTSARKPLVTDTLIEATYTPESRMVARGRQVATLYNCYGCHNVEGNDVTLHQYFGVYNEDGSFNPNNLDHMPPRLVGQGSKTQPDWLYNFLLAVNGQPNPHKPTDPAIDGEAKIRPWLEMRMPSFPMDDDDATALVEYFTGDARSIANELRDITSVIDKHVLPIEKSLTDTIKGIAIKSKQAAALEEADAEKHAETITALKAEITALGKKRDRIRLQLDNWPFQRAIVGVGDDERDTYHGLIETEATRKAMEKLADFGVTYDLIANTKALDLRFTKREDVATNWRHLYGKAKALTAAWDAEYPYPSEQTETLSDEQFARGRGLFQEMGCTTGECHRLGDELVLEPLGFSLVNPKQIVPPGGGDDDPYGENEEDDPYGENDPEGAAGTSDDDPYGENDPDDDPYGENEADDDPYGEGDDDDPYGEGGDDAGPVDPTKFALAKPSYDAKYGAPAGGAPNLTMAHQRLQPQWMRHWLRHAHTMQPGTRMLPQFMDQEDAENPAGFESFFQRFPSEMKEQRESIYGYTPEYQRNLLISFVNEAGRRKASYAPDYSLLSAAKINEIAPEQLPKLPEPVVEEDELDLAAATGDEGPDDAGDSGPTGPVVIAKTSQIPGFHDEPAIDYDVTRVIGKITTSITDRRKPIGMAADPKCAAQYTDIPPLTELHIVNKDKTIQNVLVYVSKGLPDQEWEMPAEPYRVIQQGCVYIPHIIGVRAGQTVIIENGDDTLHNVKFEPSDGANAPFNANQPAKGMTERKTFSASMNNKLSCQVHPWMGARLNVFEHPFFAVTDVEGKFEIKGLPPGTYTLKTWHEDPTIKSTEFEVTVEADKSHRADAAVNR